MPFLILIEIWAQDGIFLPHFSTEVGEAKFITLSDSVAKVGFRPRMALVSNKSPDPGQFML